MKGELKGKLLKGGLVFIVLATLVGLGFNLLLVYRASRPDVDVRPELWGWEEGLSDDEIDRRAAEIVERMTLDQKIFEMSGQGMDRMIATLLRHGYRAVVYAGGDEELRIPPIAFADGPRGIGFAAQATSFPVALARAATWDRDLERRVGEAMGKEARAANVNYFAGLSVNLLRHPSWGRAQESYGEDPWLTGEMALAMMQGVQAHNVMACIKHFALNSIENTRYHLNVEVDERTLREVYLPHFKKLIDHGAESVMSAYNKVRGEYCGHSQELLTKILRDEWGFKGFVSSDWVDGLRDGVKGIHAGMDLEMPEPEHYGDKVKDFLAAGEVTQEQIDEIVHRIVRTKIAWATKRDPQTYDASLLAHPEHVDLAREAAEESAVLLTNDGILPLDPSSGKIALLGSLINIDNTGDKGSSNVIAPYVVTPLQGLRDLLGEDAVLSADGADLDIARSLAEQAETTVIVAGFFHGEEGEYIDLDGGAPTDESEKKTDFGMSGGDRYPLGLKERDLQLIEAATEASDRVVVVLVAGSAVTVEEWKDDAEAILLAWNNGMEGGRALARLLFGEASPSGRLPLTIPHDVSELPFFDPYVLEIDYGYYHGYTHFDQQGTEPAFPFGFGLGYTTFAYDNLRIEDPEIAPGETLSVSVDVTNTGGRAGVETPQLYAGFSGFPVERPEKLLRDFAKVELAPGETKTVELTVAAEDLAWYDPEMSAWTIEEVDYEAMVGPSARTSDLLRASFRVASAEP